MKLSHPGWRLLAGFAALAALAFLAWQAARPPAAPSALKLTLRAEGLYALNPADLARLGWTHPLAQTRLTRQGEPVPAWLAGSGSRQRLIFYGQPEDTLYSGAGVYFLEAGAPLPMAVLTAPAAGPALAAFPARLRQEENHLYAPTADPPWLWLTLAAPRSETLPFTLPALAPGPASLRLALFGATEAPANPDHRLLVRLNGAEAAAESWDGRGPRLLDLPLPAGALRPGPNELTLEAPGSAGAPADLVQIDYFEITYPRPFAAENDRLLIPHSEAGIAPVEGFSGPVSVFDVTGPGSPSRLADPAPAEYPALEAGRRYWIIGPEGYLRPDNIQPAALAPDLRSPALAADYLAIGPPDLLAPLEPLLARRAAAGLAVKGIPLAAVYDQFGGGQPDPEAIRAFLRFAAEHWPAPPRFVLLVGDSTYDPRGYQAPPEANRLPSFFVTTVYGGQTVSDTRFARLAGAFAPPALAVGRLPARTPAQVAAYVQKTLAYEQAPAGGWQTRALALADGQETRFSDDAGRWLAALGGSLTSEVYAPPPGEPDAAAAIARQLEDGALFWAYFGHGSLAQLGRDALFTAAAAAELRNSPRLPVMITMTCLAGLFTHPEQESLAEALLWNPAGGAAAVLAATSLTTPEDQAALSGAFAQAYQEQPAAPLGLLLLSAQQAAERLNPSPGVREVVDTFLYFGDPAQRLAGR